MSPRLESIQHLKYPKRLFPVGLPFNLKALLRGSMILVGILLKLGGIWITPSFNKCGDKIKFNLIFYYMICLSHSSMRFNSLTLLDEWYKP